VGESSLDTTGQLALDGPLDPAAAGQQAALLGQRNGLRMGEFVRFRELFQRGASGHEAILSAPVGAIYAWKAQLVRRKPALSAQTGSQAGGPVSVELRDT